MRSGKLTRLTGDSYVVTVLQDIMTSLSVIGESSRPVSYLSHSLSLTLYLNARHAPSNRL